MSIFKLLTRPKKSIAAAVDAVIDRLNDKYALDFEIKGRLNIVDKRPKDTELLDELDKD